MISDAPIFLSFYRSFALIPAGCPENLSERINNVNNNNTFFFLKITFKLCLTIAFKEHREAQVFAPGVFLGSVLLRGKWEKK